MINKFDQSSVDLEINKILQTPAENELKKRMLFYRLSNLGSYARTGYAFNPVHIDPVFAVILDSWYHKQLDEQKFTSVTLDENEYTDIIIQRH